MYSNGLFLSSHDIDANWMDINLIMMFVDSVRRQLFSTINLLALLAAHIFLLTFPFSVTQYGWSVYGYKKQQTTQYWLTEESL